MRIARMIGALMAAGLFASTPAHAVPQTGNYGRAIYLTGGWTDPNLRVQLDIPFFNPHGCPLSDGYVVPATLPANALFNAMLLTANTAASESD